MFISKPRAQTGLIGPDSNIKDNRIPATRQEGTYLEMSVSAGQNPCHPNAWIQRDIQVYDHWGVMGIGQSEQSLARRVKARA